MRVEMRQAVDLDRVIDFLSVIDRQHHAEILQPAESDGVGQAPPEGGTGFGARKPDSERLGEPDHQRHAISRRLDQRQPPLWAPDGLQNPGQDGRFA